MAIETRVYRTGRKPNRSDEKAILSFLRENCGAPSFDFDHIKTAFLDSFMNEHFDGSFTLTIEQDNQIKGIVIVNYNTKVNEDDNNIYLCVVPDKNSDDKEPTKSLLQKVILHMKNEMEIEELIQNALKSKN